MGSIWLNGRTAGYPSLADVVRSTGAAVQLWDGWENRSRSSGGFTICAGNVDHHTASPTTMPFYNDWSYCAVGNADAPVANMLIGRQGQCGIHAAGASNHAGKGGPWTCSKGKVSQDAGNSNLVGIEVSNNGTGEPWPPVQQDVYTAVVAALADAYGWDLRERGTYNTDTLAHFEWVLPSCPGRKIDPWGPARFTGGVNKQWDMNAFRAETRAKQGGAIGPAPTPEGDDMLTVFEVNGAGAKFLGFTNAGMGHTVSWLDTQAKLDTYARHPSVGKLTVEVADMKNLWLVGPVPTGDARVNWTPANFAP